MVGRSGGGCVRWWVCQVVGRSGGGCVRWWVCQVVGVSALYLRECQLRVNSSTQVGGVPGRVLVAYRWVY